MEPKQQHIKHVVPHKILQYIDQHYDGVRIADIKEEELEGLKLFKVVLEEGDNVHYLQFNEAGNLLKTEEEGIFERNRHEDFFRQEGFYEN